MPGIGRCGIVGIAVVFLTPPGTKTLDLALSLDFRIFFSGCAAAAEVALDEVEVVLDAVAEEAEEVPAEAEADDEAEEEEADGSLVGDAGREPNPLSALAMFAESDVAAPLEAEDAADGTSWGEDRWLGIVGL